MWHKNSIDNQYHSIINLSSLDICDLIENASKYPALEKTLKWFNITFPGLSHKCPYMVRDKFELI